MAAFIHAWAEFVVARRAAIIVATLLLFPLIIFSGGAIPFENNDVIQLQLRYSFQI
tara:strand:+ start:794 stop:961 length:168 start_codon:yes stop_codon:yes gene_type:complete